MRFPLDRVQTILDRYATLGKELHITEFTPTSGGQRITGSHVEGVWDEAAQADYAEKFYRVCFAHPALRAITWWDLSDQHSWLKGGGMLRGDMTPKPVYEQLRRLIHEEWTTRLAGTDRRLGPARIPGFPRRLSDHREARGRAVTQPFTLTKEKPQSFAWLCPLPIDLAQHQRRRLRGCVVAGRAVRVRRPAKRLLLCRFPAARPRPDRVIKGELPRSLPCRVLNNTPFVNLGGARGAIRVWPFGAAGVRDDGG